MTARGNKYAGRESFSHALLYFEKGCARMTQKEINKQFAEVQGLYEKAKQIADIAIQIMKDANKRLKELNEELARCER